LAPEHVNDIHTFLADSHHAFTYLADAAAATLDPTSDIDSGSFIEAIQNTENAIETAVEGVVEAEAEVAAKSGWWAAYLALFKSALNFVHDGVDGPLRSVGITQTWGVSIAIFTATVRSLLIPLSLQQSKSSEYIKALKPQMQQIKEKFKDNKDQQNRAIGKLYEDADQNPLSGCLVSLVQLPIFLGLYRGVRLLASDGNLDEPFLWIPSLEGPVTAPDYRGLDWLTTGWVDGVPQLGWETTLAFLIMPVILVLGQSLSMNILTPSIDDDMEQEEKEQMEKSQVVLKFLPLLIGFFSLQVPAALTIYLFTSNGFTLSQSLAVRAYYKANPPEIELPDYWDALDNVDDMSADEKRAAAKAGISVGPSFDDMKDESKFHVVVKRTPLRENSAAWQKVDTLEIPTAFAAWVGGDGQDADAGEKVPDVNLTAAQA